MMYLRWILMAVLLILCFLAESAQAEPPERSIPASKRILVPLLGWEHGVWNGQFTAWFNAMKAAGYTVDVVADKGPALTGRELLAKYDVVMETTRSSLCNDRRFQQALEEFVRQGGGFVMIETTDQQAWIHSPMNQWLPTTFYATGFGWNSRSGQVRIAQAAQHPATKGLDWKIAPPLPSMSSTPAPDSEMFRGSLQLMGPRENLIKPLLNNNWQEILWADDAERSPLAVVGRYGRGRILIWGGALGGDPIRSEPPAPLLKWDGFPTMCGQFVSWAAGGGKVVATQPQVWVAGDSVDDLKAKGGTGEPWSFGRVVSYALPEFGLSQSPEANDAQAALVLKADPLQAASLAKLAKAGMPLMVCAPGALDGALSALLPLTADVTAPPSLPTVTLGTAAPAPAAPKPVAAAPAIKVLKEADLQPPQEWRVKATNSVTFQRDLQQQWYAPRYDDATWPTRGLGEMKQTIGGKVVHHSGAIWYRARVVIPKDLPIDAVWTFQTASDVTTALTSVRAWLDGAETKLDGASLRLQGLPAGEHLLAVRLYNAGGGDYWNGSRKLLANPGLLAIHAEQRPPSDPAPWSIPYIPPGDMPPSDKESKSPLLFHHRADGDKDFRLSFRLTAEQAKQTPLLLFNEPAGLIRQVRINGGKIDRVNTGLWDGVSGDDLSAFLCKDVLKEGENLLEFRPDFTRLRGQDYSVDRHTRTPCSLPRLEFTGDVQALIGVDAQLAPLVPNRLFKPGKTRAPAPGARVLLRWNDGRAALVQKDKIATWTSDVAVQMNALPVHHWHLPMETSGPWDIETGVWENAAPLLAAVLAGILEPASPRLLEVRRSEGQPDLELIVDNPGDAWTGLLAYRLLSWQGSILASQTQPVALAAHGRTTIKVPVPRATFAGDELNDQYLLRAGLRSSDNALGWCYFEKVIELPPPVRVSIATDTLAGRVERGSIPDRLPDNPHYRGRHLWSPLLHKDVGSTVYADGETAHLRVTLTNRTDVAQTVPLTIELRAQSRQKVEKRLEKTVTLKPGERQTVEMQHPLTGKFEPYLLRVTTGAPGSVREKTRPLFSVKPWKQSFNVDVAPRADGLSFNCFLPFMMLQQADNLKPCAKEQGFIIDPHTGTFPELLEWMIATRTATQGHGGGSNGYQGMTEGFGWGPFFNNALNAPNQMSVLPNGQPFLHYIAEGMQRQKIGPARYSVADFWGNFWVPVDWNTLPAFREWLAIQHPQKKFNPRTFKEAKTQLHDHFVDEWNEWQNAMMKGAWGAVKQAATPGSIFWNQADHTLMAVEGQRNEAADRPVDGTTILKFYAGLFAAGDPDPGTSRMGFGYRYRSYLMTTAAALAPNLHFNVSTLRHMYMLNEQRMRNMGQAAPESYRSHAYDTIWSATVRPNGSLRAVVDTPPSEVLHYAAPTWNGLKFGNRLYDRMYRLAGVIEPQQALGLLWVAPVHRSITPNPTDPRVVYETLRNLGVPLSATIGPELLELAPRTGAGGLVYLVPKELNANESKALGALVGQGFPVLCLVTPATDAVRAQLPSQVKVIDWPEVLPPQEARKLAEKIKSATGKALEATDGTCVYGFKAAGRTFVVVQEMWGRPRSVHVDVTEKAANLDGVVGAVNLNDNSKLEVARAKGKLEVTVPLGPWDAVLLVLASPAP